MKKTAILLALTIVLTIISIACRSLTETSAPDVAEKAVEVPVEIIVIESTTEQDAGSVSPVSLQEQAVQKDVTADNDDDSSASTFGEPESSATLPGVTSDAAPVTARPTSKTSASSEPTTALTSSPTAVPTKRPTPKPTDTVKPAVSPTVKPTSTPLQKPTGTPKPTPKHTDTPKPTATPKPHPTAMPMPKPTATPTPTPEESSSPGWTCPDCNTWFNFTTWDEIDAHMDCCPNKPAPIPTPTPTPSGHWEQHWIEDVPAVYEYGYKCNHCGAKFPGNYYDNYVPLHLEPTMEESAKKHVCHIENWNTPDVMVICACGYVWKLGDSFPYVIWGHPLDPFNAATVNANHPYCEAHGGHISYSDLIIPAEGHWETVWVPDP